MKILFADIQMVRPELFVICCGRMDVIQHQELIICEFTNFYDKPVIYCKFSLHSRRTFIDLHFYVL